MSSTSAGAAGRGSASQRAPRRRFWGDARFGIGVLLVAASVAGVWFVIGAARQTVPVLVAAATLVPGQRVTPGDVAVVEVALGPARDAYAAPDALGDGMVALRTIGRGELLPAGAVGAAGAVERTAVVVRSAVDVPAAVDRGAVVELWETPPAGEAGTFGAPRVLVGDAVVAGVTRDDGVMAAAGASLELVIDRARVADVLSAEAAGSVLSVVPAPGAAAGPPDAAPRGPGPGDGGSPAGEGDRE
jgi:hypothetical protein